MVTCGFRAITTGLIALCAFACTPESGATGAPGDGNGGTPGDAAAHAGSGGGGASNGSGGSMPQGGAPTAAAACEAELDDECAFMARCEPGVVSYYYGSAAKCKELKRPSCVDRFSAPGSKLQPADLVACGRSYVQSDCTVANTAAAPTIPSCVFHGTLPNGAACRYDAQCETSICKTQSYDAECGTCTPVSPEGASCYRTHECGDGLRCSVRKNICVKALTLGQTCDGSSDECVFPLTCRSGTCQKAPRIGDTCLATTEMCDPSQDSECLPKTGLCTLISYLAEGQACDPSQAILCQPWLVCSGTCRAESGPCADCLLPGFCRNSVCMRPLAADCK